MEMRQYDTLQTHFSLMPNETTIFFAETWNVIRPISIKQINRLE